MGLPDIRRSLSYVETYAADLMKKTDNIREAATDFAREWYNVFKKKLDVNDAVEYLKHAAEFQAQPTKQKGGSAPIDYQMRAGDAPPYGTVLPYVAGGFGLGIPEMSSTSLCAAGGSPTPMPYPDTGSNSMKGGARRSRRNSRKQEGGGFLNTLSNIFSHAPPSAPTSFITDAQTAMKGQPLPPGGASTVRAWNYSGTDVSSLKTVLSTAQGTTL
jgi:hypothetical protein